MVRTPTFYLLWIAYCLGAAAGLMVISQLVPVGEAAGLGAAAGLGLTIGAIGNTGGRVLSGWMSDTFGRLNTLRLMVLLSAVALPLFFLLAGQVALFYLLLVVIYYCYGTLLSVFASTCADFYGTRNMGVNYGLLFSAWGVAGIVGPVIAGRVFDATGTYEVAFYVAAALSVVALGALMLSKPPQGAGRGVLIARSGHAWNIAGTVERRPGRHRRRRRRPRGPPLPLHPALDSGLLGGLHAPDRGGHRARHGRGGGQPQRVGPRLGQRHGGRSSSWGCSSRSP